MDKKIIRALDELDISETEKLLGSSMKIDMDSSAMNRIKSSVFEKTGVRRRKRIYQRPFAVSAAAVILVFLSVFTVGFDNVANAFGKLFSFIPGYAIVEKNKTIEYVLDGENIKTEDKEMVISLKNAIATKDSITVSL